MPGGTKHQRYTNKDKALENKSYTTVWPGENRRGKVATLGCGERGLDQVDDKNSLVSKALVLNDYILAASMVQR